MTRIRRGTLTNASVAILAPMSFDSNTDLWKHTSHFEREETFKFAIWNYRICWLPGNVWASAGKKEIPFTGISNISHCHVPRGKFFGSGQVFPEIWMYEKVEEWPVNEFQNCEGLQTAAKWHFFDLFLSHMGPEDSPNRKKDPKIQKISENPKNQNNSENVSLKIRPCRPWKLGPLFSHEKTTFKWSIVVSEAVFSTN